MILLTLKVIILVGKIHIYKCDFKKISSKSVVFFLIYIFYLHVVLASPEGYQTLSLRVFWGKPESKLGDTVACHSHLLLPAPQMPPQAPLFFYSSLRKLLNMRKVFSQIKLFIFCSIIINILLLCFCFAFKWEYVLSDTQNWHLWHHLVL